jgi:hypothetical protein
MKNIYKSRNKMHLQKLLAQSQMESLSDSEIFKGLKISSGAYSDAEDDNKFSKQGKNPGYLSGTESRKLERKVVQNHVRLEVSSSERGTEQVINQNNSSSRGNNSRLGIRSSLSPKMNTSDSELKVPRTENHRNHPLLTEGDAPFTGDNDLPLPKFKGDINKLLSLDTDSVSL